MKNKNVSIKSVFNNSMTKLRANWTTVFLSSLLQFAVFGVLFLLTNSLMISLIGWILFLPTQSLFLNNVDNENCKFEQVFKIGKNVLTYLLLAMLSVICYVFGFALAIVPAVLIFINYAFVFDFVREYDLKTSIQKSRELAKGYRPKLLGISLIYLFIFLVLVAFGVLVAMLFGMWLNTNHFMLYIWGVFGGISLFLICVAPVMILTINEFKQAILKDKEEKQNKPENVTEQPEQTNEQPKAEAEQENLINNQEIITQEPEQGDPTDLIV